MWKLVLCCCLAACSSYQTIQTGHRGLRFEPAGGLKREIVSEGRYKLGRGCTFHACSSLIDFDVTFSKAHEEIKTNSQEGLALELGLSISYKPIVSELYELATEVSIDRYYEEVVQPEFRSAASGVFARHSYTELAGNKEKIEDEIEADVQRRIKGKHIAVSSITLETINYAQEIQDATRARLVGEQDALREKSQLANEAARKRSEIQNRSDEEQLKLSTELAEKKHERELAEEDVGLQKALAAAAIERAHAEAEVTVITAKAKAEENRAATQAISPLTVQMKAYEALGQLGGKGTTILLGDFSHLPAWLMPPGLLGLGGRATP